MSDRANLFFRSVDPCEYMLKHVVMHDEIVKPTHIDSNCRHSA